jgi:hypothetical protein
MPSLSPTSNSWHLFHTQLTRVQLLSNKYTEHNYVEEDIPRGAKAGLISKQISIHLLKTQIHYPAYNTKTVIIFTHYFLKIHFNIILMSTTRSPK